MGFKKRSSPEKSGGKKGAKGREVEPPAKKAAKPRKQYRGKEAAAKFAKVRFVMSFQALSRTTAPNPPSQVVIGTFFFSFLMFDVLSRFTSQTC